MPRLPGHLKVYTSLLSDPAMFAVVNDNDLLATWVRIGLLAIRNYADRHGDSFMASRRDLEWLTGCRRGANPERRLGRIVATGALTYSQEGAGFRLTVRKFAESQFPNRTNGSVSDSPTTTTTTTTTATTTKSRRNRRRARQGRLPVAARPEPRPVPEWSLSVAKLLAELLTARHRGGRVPDDLATWAREIAAIDADPSEIAGNLRWAYSPENEPPFRIEIQSGKALRDKYAQLLAKRERVKAAGTSSGGHVNAVGAAVAKIAEEGAGDRAQLGE